MPAPVVLTKKLHQHDLLTCNSNLEQETDVICLSSEEEQLSDKEQISHEEQVDYPPQEATPVVSVPSQLSAFR